MDFKKLNVLTLTGPNSGSYAVQVQAVAKILDCWDIIKGEALGTQPQTYDLLTKPTTQSHTNAKECVTTMTVWNKKISQALGPIQGTISLALWPDYVNQGTAKLMWDALEAKFRKAGRASTYFQLVNMVKIQFTNSLDLLLQIQEFQENCTQILSNGHSTLSKDITTFIFCSCLPNSYQDTTWKYFDNITSIANYKIQDTIN